MIVVGYPGIGTEAMCEQHIDCVKISSSDFSFKDENGAMKKWHKWGEICINVAETLSKQCNIVCIPFHPDLIPRLKDTKETVRVVVPALSVKDKWVKKLYYRYLDTLSNEDYIAWENAGKSFIGDVKEMIYTAEENEWKLIMLDDTKGYDLYTALCLSLGGEDI